MPTETSTLPTETSTLPTETGQGDVSCGPVDTPGGTKVNVIEDSTPAGRVGCTESINVITDYFKHANEAEGTGHFLTIDGWKCGADTGAHGTGTIACQNKEKLSFHTQAA